MKIKNVFIMIMRRNETPRIHRMNCKDVEKDLLGKIKAFKLTTYGNAEHMVDVCTERYGNAYGYKILSCTK